MLKINLPQDSAAATQPRLAVAASGSGQAQHTAARLGRAKLHRDLPEQRTRFAQTFANVAKAAASVWPRNWCDVEGPAEDCRGGEPVPQPVGGQAAAAFGEQEVGRSAVPRSGRARRAIHSSRAATTAAASRTVRSAASSPSGTFQQAAVARPLPRAASSARSSRARPCSVASRSLTLDIQSGCNSVLPLQSGESREHPGSTLANVRRCRIVRRELPNARTSSSAPA